MSDPVLVEVYADTRGAGRCRACGVPLTWYRTVKDRAMPFTGDPVPRSSRHDDAHRLILRLAAEDSHFVTCPQADRFRRRPTR